MINSDCRSNEIRSFGKLPDDMRIDVLRYSITTSLKPTNTAFALMCTSKEFFIISKNLFDRDSEVLVSFVHQIKSVVKFWTSSKSVFIEFHKNTFFFLRMVDVLKDKTLEEPLKDSIIKKLGILKAKKMEVLECLAQQKIDDNIKNNCKEIIELVFVEPINFKEITFEAISPLFAQIYPHSVDDYSKFKKLMLGCIVSYEILFYVTKNISSEGCFLLIEKIGHEINDKFDKEFFWKNGELGRRYHSTDISLASDYIGENGNKLSRLIERLAELVINEKSSSELKDAYLMLIGQFLDKLIVFALKGQLQDCYSDKLLYLELKSFLPNNNFKNLAFLLIRLLRYDFKSIPDCTFDVIFELKNHFPEEYKLVSGIIERFKQTHHCILENVKKIKRRDVRYFFLKEIGFPFFDQLSADDKICTDILRRVIVISRKPAHTALTLMCTSKKWCELSKDLFDKDPLVHTSFVRQVEVVADGWYLSYGLEPRDKFHKNILFFLWMMDFLKDEISEMKHKDLIKKLEIIKAKEKDLLGVFAWQEIEDCKKIIEQVFVGPTNLKEITFAEISSLFAQIHSNFWHWNNDKGEIRNRIIAFEILFYVLKNLSSEGSCLLINEILQKIRGNLGKEFFWNGGPDPMSFNYSKFPSENGYKISRLIERLGKYVINEKSVSELKNAYIKLIVQFLGALLDFTVSKSNLNWKTNEYTCYEDWQKRSFLEDNNFKSLAIQFIQLLGNDLDNIPDCTFDIIFELKNQFSNEYELATSIIERFKKTKHFIFENIDKIKRDNVRSYFLKELSDLRESFDITFQYFGGKKCYGREMLTLEVREMLLTLGK